jgi:hypothetical protein
MEEKNTKEINLLDLIKMFSAWVVKASKSFINFILYLLKAGYRKKYLTLTLIVLCFAIGEYMARPSNRQYSVGAMASLHGVDAFTMKEIARQLEQSRADNQYTSLSSKLSLPDSIAKNIVSFNSYYVIDYLNDSTPDMVDFANNHSLEDTLNVRMKDKIYFRLITRNISQVPQVEKAILNFFNSQPIVQLKYTARINELRGKIDISAAEMQRLDSLAKITYFKDTEKQLKWSKDRLIVGEQQKQLFYGEMLFLQGVRSKAESELMTYKQPVEFPSGFVINPFPMNGKIKYGIYGILIGLGLGLVFAACIEQLQKVIRFFKK